MTKIAQQKALEAYPIESHEFYDCDYKERNAFKQGYDQAMQDFLEKAEEWLKDNSKKYAVCYEDGYSHYAYNSMIKDFKNYMQNE